MLEVTLHGSGACHIRHRVPTHVVVNRRSHQQGGEASQDTLRHSFARAIDSGRYHAAEANHVFEPIQLRIVCVIVTLTEG